MEKFILFPKNEFKQFNEGVKYFNAQVYDKALYFFEEAVKIKYFKKECIKYLIDCHIELHHFDEVYRMIENEFVDKNVDEEYLLKKYLYAMILEEQYVEVGELINIYKYSKNITPELNSYFTELEKIIDKYEKSGKGKANMMKYFLSNDFEDHLQIIFHLDQLDVDKYQIEINNFLNNSQIDAFIKYSLLKYLMENNKVDKVKYTNYFNEHFIIDNDEYIDLLSNQLFYQPIESVLDNLDNKTVAKEYIKNIWLDFCVKYYPHLIHDIKLASAVLHALILRTMNSSVNINDICALYNIEPNRLFNYFKM